MAVKLVNIYKNLNYNEKSLYSRYNGEEFLVDAKLLENDLDFLRRNVLYLSYSSFLNKIDTKNISNCNLLIINDENYDLKKLTTQNVSIIEYSNFTKINDLLVNIKDMFTNDFALIDSSAILLDALIKEKGIDDIVEIGSELLQNPVVIIDSGFKVLAHSTVEKITEPFWVKNINMGYCSYEFISTAKNIESFKESANSIKPFIAICDESPIRKLVSKIIINNSPIGYIITLESNKKFTDNTYEVTELLSKIVAEKLKKDNIYRNSNGFMYENLIVDILEEKIVDKNKLKNRMKSIELKANLQLILVDISNYIPLKNKSNYLKKSLDEIFPDNKSLFYEKYIILLVDFESDSYMDFRKNLILNNFLKSHELVITISPSFNSILEINKYYHQCKDSLSLIYRLNLNDNIFLYEDLKFYHLLYNVDSNINILTFCSNKLLKLIDYDKKNNTDYFNTLKVYIESDKNAIRASKKLYIHRNTINYRLNKINEISGIDFSNTDEMFRLNMSMKILEFNQ